MIVTDTGEGAQAAGGQPVQRELAFSQAEMDSRLSRVQQGLRERGLDLLLSHSPENIFYLTGHRTPGYYAYQCVAVSAEGEPTLVVRRGELGNARTYSTLADIVAYEDTDDPVEATVRALNERDRARGTIGIDRNAWFFTVANYLRLEEALGSVRLQDGSGIVERARTIKSAEELAYVRRAARAAEAGMARAVQAIADGCTENDIATAMWAGLIGAGSEYQALEPFVASGPRAAAMHATWSGRLLEQGDATLLELAGCVRRYGAALMRTVALGDPGDEARRLSAVCLEALEHAIAAIRPGVTSGEVDEACRGTIERAGYAEYFRKRTGYSIGVAFAPDWGEGHILSLKRDDPTVLMPGMVFHIPPALRIPGRVGVGFSETVLVTDSGREVITRFPRELIAR